MTLISRRRFLASGALAAGTMTFGPGLLREALAAPATAGASPYGPLLPPDANDLMLPPGFGSRLIARRLESVPGTSYSFPIFPDGQATFPTLDKGWILVTNSESPSASGGGASAIRFGADGGIASAYRILGGTNINCAGGPTPWGTWLSCEEIQRGLVWECDPAGVLGAEPRPALGLFNHEAAAVDPVARRLYLTEDEPDGGFYRFTPASYPDLNSGLLEVAVVDSAGMVTWRTVPDPMAAGPTPTRQQVPEMTEFQGGEGLWHDRGVLYFTTKGDKKVWAYEPARGRLEVLFDRAQAMDSALDAVDNVTVSSAGEIFVCEDGGNLEIGLITPQRAVSPFLRFAGPNHEGSEVCGAAFDPSGTRLYLTSQRGFPAGPQVGPVPPSPLRRRLRDSRTLPAGGRRRAIELPRRRAKARWTPEPRQRPNRPAAHCERPKASPPRADPQARSPGKGRGLRGLLGHIAANHRQSGGQARRGRCTEATDHPSVAHARNRA